MLYPIPNAFTHGDYEIGRNGQLSATDVVMGLFGPNDETRFVTEDDDSGRNDNARIDEPQVPGTYHLRIRHYRPTGTGKYSVAVRPAAPDAAGKPAR